MNPRYRRPVHEVELALLGLALCIVVALGWVVAVDVGRIDYDARRLYARLSQGLDLIDKLQFETQEVRRILLYALQTSNANRQLEYAEQSRAVDARVQQLLSRRPELLWAAGTYAHLDDVDRTWRRYLVVRDEVIGLILEGSLREGVALDEHQGATLFNEVRQSVANLRTNFASDEEIQIAEAERGASREMVRLAMLVASAVAAAIGVSLFKQHTAIEARLRSEAQKGSILEAVPNAVISTDSIGRIIELNHAAERTFGVTRGAALGARLEQTVLPPDRHHVLIDVLSRADGSLPLRIETVGGRSDGSTFPMELGIVGHTAGRDRIWTLVLADLTERQRTEEIVRRAKETEAETRARSEFLVTVSHELRTPLSGVIGIVELLQRVEPPAEQRELFRMLQSSAASLFHVINDILDHSRMEAGSTELAPVTFSVRQCVEDALDPVTDLAARQGLDIGYVVEPEVPAFIVADQNRVRQVLLNLVSNAVKFTDAGEVSIHVSSTDGPYDSVAIKIAVRDTGCGIPTHLHGKLFQRFSQIDATLTRRHGGAGLGLPISDSLSRLLGGSLTVESTVGTGSTFTMVFSARVAPGGSERDPLDGSLAGLRVVTFPGPGIVGQQIRSILQRLGARVVPATEGSEKPLIGNRVDAIVVDSEAFEGRLHAEALETRARWRGSYVPIISVSRSLVVDADARDHAIRVPVREHALHQALAACAASTAVVSLRPDDEPATRVRVGAGLRILLVDDNHDNRDIFRLMLEELGCEVGEAASGAEAIAGVLARAYDVIFMDVRMPDMDGLEATRRIKSEGGPTPVVIAVTANVARGEEARCRAAGMDGYLPKPLRLSTLAALLGPLAQRRSGAAAP